MGDETASDTERRGTGGSARTNGARIELGEAEDVGAVVLAFRRDRNLLELAEASPPVASELEVHTRE